MNPNRIFFICGNFSKEFKRRNKLLWTAKKFYSFSDVSQERFKNLNSMYQDYKNKNKFEIHKPYEKTKYFITENQKTKQREELQKILKDFTVNYHDLDIFNEQSFMNLLKVVSNTYDNSSVLEDAKFLEIIQRNVDNLNKFTNFNNAILLMSFCNYHKIEKEEIWRIFKAYIFNNYRDFQYATKILVLCSFNETKYKKGEKF